MPKNSESFTELLPCCKNLSIFTLKEQNRCGIQLWRQFLQHLFFLVPSQELHASLCTSPFCSTDTQVKSLDEKSSSFSVFNNTPHSFSRDIHLLNRQTQYICLRASSFQVFSLQLSKVQTTLSVMHYDD